MSNNENVEQNQPKPMVERLKEANPNVNPAVIQQAFASDPNASFADLDRLIKAQGQIKDELAGEPEACDTSKKSLVDLGKEIELQNQQVLVLTDRARQAAQKIQDQKKIIAELQVQNDESKGQKEQVGELKQKLDECNQKNAELQAELQKLQEELKKLNETQSFDQTRLANSSAVYNELRKAIDAESEQLRGIVELEQNAEQQLKDLAANREDANVEQIQNLQQRLVERAQKIRQKIDEDQAKLANLANQIETLQQQITNTDEQKSILEKEIQDIKDNIEKNDSDRDGLNAGLQKCREEKNALLELYRKHCTEQAEIMTAQQSQIKLVNEKLIDALKTLDAALESGPTVNVQQQQPIENPVPVESDQQEAAEQNADVSE